MSQTHLSRAGSAGRRLLPRRKRPASLAWGHLALVAALLIGWQILYVVVGENVFASPAETGTAFVSNLPDWYPDLRSTLTVLVIAMIATAVLGVLIGFLVGLSEFWTEVLRPILLTIYAIPKIAIYPIFLLVFKIGFSTLVLFSIFHGIIPVILLVMEGTRGIPAIQIKLARVYNLSFLQKCRYILLPSLAPVVAEAVRMGASLTFLGLVVAEMFGSSSGLGNRLVAYLNLNQTENILSVFILISLVGIVLSVLLLHWERSVQRRSGLVPDSGLAGPKP
ncbi:ABC transporter permease [Nocardioides massiliensis]|uniref:NitT/TauT family transport system permease protein n=1 Tax=Nocardioides massiliensis TaxID=1325935 RepID=A0ABT9NTC8_9ACTN|nr:ABC transporter permease subunit [Nocardioides massiliensis]MDP9821151.1 NitT/TauT family transport system permease protein [Nocardioides massiliensis]MDP9823675.1 NitT/TauT family transport system permease protein [Nocardioides massiliensis]